MTPPPDPARPASDADLGFERRPMVRWLDPHQLLDTSARVLASGFLTSYTDSRDMQALVSACAYDRSGSAEMWIDYVSDLGDGWNSTYTVACLLAQEKLDLQQADDVHATERGRILIMGGDEVYPVPTRTQYENRLIGPYRAALPCAADDPPELFAIPGSHDWYDGLLNFVNVFCRGRFIGGWKTSQSRSYFALRLPHGWSLWGVDLQFGDYLDEAQVAYFAEAARAIEPGERIIICLAKEVESGRKSAEVSSDRNLGYLEREVVHRAGAEIVLYLKSGRHHYCRYESAEEGKQFITAGGGGAFLHPTHNLPEVAKPPTDEASGPFRLAALYPSRAASRRLRKRVWLLPAYNVPLAVALGVIQVLLVFMLNLHLHGRHVSVGFNDLRQALWESPTAFLLISLIVLTFGGMIRLAHDASGFTRLAIGLGHSLLQFGGLGLVLVIASRISSPLGDSAPSLAVFLGLVFVLGGVGGVLGVSGYLWATNCFGFHGNEAFAPLHHMDQKNFLRLHIDADGGLTLYPVGIERVTRRWRFDPDAPPSAPWLVPASDQRGPHLIERPVVYGPQGGDQSPGDDDAAHRQSGMTLGGP